MSLSPIIRKCHGSLDPGTNGSGFFSKGILPKKARSIQVLGILIGKFCSDSHTVHRIYKLLKLTAKAPLKITDWKIYCILLGLLRPIFRGVTASSFREGTTIPKISGAQAV